MVGVSGVFGGFVASFFDHLNFVKGNKIQEPWPLRLLISYPMSEENQQLVAETYSTYQATDPNMVAWLGGKK